MEKTIEQSVFLAAPPKMVYQTYLTSAGHTAMTAPARISPKAGARFTAFDGLLSGTNLLLEPGRLIVQRWRSVSFKPADPDSILILTLYPERKGTRLHLVHVNVPSHDFKGVTKGWKKYYWKPWANFIAVKKGTAKLEAMGKIDRSS